MACHIRGVRVGWGDGWKGSPRTNLQINNIQGRLNLQLEFDQSVGQMLKRKVKQRWMVSEDDVIPVVRKFNSWSVAWPPLSRAWLVCQGCSLVIILYVGSAPHRWPLSHLCDVVVTYMQTLAVLSVHYTTTTKTVLRLTWVWWRHPGMWNNTWVIMPNTVQSTSVGESPRKNFFSAENKNIKFKITNSVCL